MSSGNAEPISSNEVNAGSAEMSETELRAELQKLQPKSELGRNLIALALRGLDEGVPRLSPDEIRAYLGRDRYVEDLP